MERRLNDTPINKTVFACLLLTVAGRGGMAAEAPKTLYDSTYSAHNPLLFVQPKPAFNTVARTLTDAPEDAMPDPPKPAAGPQAPHPASSVSPATQQDYQNMMEQMRITSLRPGASGSKDPTVPHAGNYDEAKANPYPILPDPLLLKDGEKVTTAKAWWEQRRPEIVGDFDREIYGRVPPNTPKVTWAVLSSTPGMSGGVPILTKRLVGHVDNSSDPAITVEIQMTLTTPINASGPVPVMMQIGSPKSGGPGGSGDLPEWQQMVMDRGWGYAIFSPNSVQLDNGAGLTEGIIGLCNKGHFRKPDDWGALRAWAWGAGRALDYLQTDKAVDAKQVGLEGHSRYGKAALVTMAYEPRFAIAYVSSSGEGGAKLLRRNWGELVENLAAIKEYHWMAGNFLKYAGPLTPGDLPVDAHELIALCAPRPVFISGGATHGDGWVDAKGMFMAAAAAGPVYRLLGRSGLGTDEFPPMETGLTTGDVAFRQHSGGHTDAPNWPVFLAFADRYLKRPTGKATGT